jgi:hypothetical protein
MLGRLLLWPLDANLIPGAARKSRAERRIIRTGPPRPIPSMRMHLAEGAVPKKIYLWPEPPREDENSGLISAPIAGAIKWAGSYLVFPPPPKKQGRPPEPYKDVVRGKILAALAREHTQPRQARIEEAILKLCEDRISERCARNWANEFMRADTERRQKGQ